MASDCVDKVNWQRDGLVAAVTQEHGTGTVLTVAWMNREALQRTVETGMEILAGTRERYQP